MSNNDAEIQNIELEMSAAKEIIADRDALDRLTANADFNRIIRKGYFEKEASRVVLLKAEAAMEDPQKQQNILDQITGIGMLYQYFRGVMVQGQQADAAMADYDEALEELHKEGLDS